MVQNVEVLDMTDVAEKKRIVVCVSGGGTNLQAIIDACEPGGRIENAEVVAVISNVAGVKALERAAKHQIPAAVIRPKDYDDRERFDEDLAQIILTHRPDLIVLAGFLVQIPTILLENFHGPVINIHPALIPSFCGKGMYGLKVHEAALAKGVKVTGATVHFVDASLDTGPIIAQLPVPVCEGDTPEVLQKRVMEKAEWKILPWAINHIVNGRIWLENGNVMFDNVSPLDWLSGWSAYPGVL